MSSTDKPGTATVDNQSPAQARQPEHPPPRQPEDPRSRAQYNNDTYAKPPVYRRHDGAGGAGAERPDGAIRSHDSSNAGKDANTKAGPATDRTTPRNPERSAGTDASVSARQPTSKDTRTVAEYNRDTQAGPPVHRYKDDNPGVRPEGNNRVTAGGSLTADAKARPTQNAERAGPTPTDRGDPAGREAPADARSTADHTRDHTAQVSERPMGAVGSGAKTTHDRRSSTLDKTGTPPDALAQLSEIKTASREPHDGSTPEAPAAYDVPAADARDCGGTQSHHEQQIKHFHSDFKGHSLDLYSDGKRWASEDRSSKTDAPDDSDDEKNRYDPLPSGEELVDAPSEESSRLEKLRRNFYQKSDDALDALDKNTNSAHDIFSRPPAGGHAEMPTHQPYVGAPQHSGLDAGSIATSVLVAGLILDRAARWAAHRHPEHPTR